MKFSNEDLQLIDYWLLHKDLEDSTLKTYFQCLKYYCKLINLSPDELIRQADSEEEKGIKLRDRKINFYFLYFLSFSHNCDRTYNHYLFLHHNYCRIQTYYKYDY